jgi:hypothetical protein
MFDKATGTQDHSTYNSRLGISPIKEASRTFLTYKRCERSTKDLEAEVSGSVTSSKGIYGLASTH